MHPDSARTIAQMAYVWGWPIINMINRRAKITQAHIQAASMAYCRPRLAARTFVACPNQDVVYGLGFFSLDEEPVVSQVPDFGSRFWVYAMYDARTDQFGRLGKPYNSKPGFYLLVERAEAARHYRCYPLLHLVGQCNSRVFQDDTSDDKKATQAVINQILAYPLKDFTGQMKKIEWIKAPNISAPQSSDGGETKWVIPEKFFDQFEEALNIVDPLPGEQAMYRQFRLLLDPASKDPGLKKVLVATAVETEKNVIQPFFQWKHNGRPAGNGWNRSTTMPSGVSTISTEPAHRNRTCSITGRTRRNNSTPTMTAPALSSMAAAAMRSRLARHQEQDPQAQPRRFAHALCRGEVAGS